MLRSVAASGAPAAAAMSAAGAGGKLLALVCAFPEESGEAPCDVAVAGAALLLRDLLERGDFSRYVSKRRDITFPVGDTHLEAVQRACA